MIERYRTMVADLEGGMRHDITRARTILTDLLGRIEIREKEGGIFALVGHPAANIALAAGDPFLTVVAGAGFCTQKRRSFYSLDEQRVFAGGKFVWVSTRMVR